jgi:hypothetical protein
MQLYHRGAGCGKARFDAAFVLVRRRVAYVNGGIEGVDGRLVAVDYGFLWLCASQS